MDSKLGEIQEGELVTCSECKCSLEARRCAGCGIKAIVCPRCGAHQEPACPECGNGKKRPGRFSLLLEPKRPVAGAMWCCLKCGATSQWFRVVVDHRYDKTDKVIN